MQGMGDTLSTPCPRALGQADAKARLKRDKAEHTGLLDPTGIRWLARSDGVVTREDQLAAPTMAWCRPGGQA